jgi:hypothetical protein
MLGDRKRLTDVTTIGAITVPSGKVVATTVIWARGWIALWFVRFPAHVLMVLSHCIFTSCCHKFVQQDGVATNRAIGPKGGYAIDWRKRYAIVG